MPSRTITVEELEFDTATDTELGAAHELWLRIEREELPDDPDVPREQRLAEFRNQPSYRRHRRWVIWDDDRRSLRAYSVLAHDDVEDNKNLAWFQILVAPEHRRNGYATRLLAPMIDTAREYGWDLFTTWTWEGSPGVPFLEAIGGENRQQSRHHRLYAGEIDRDMLQSWVDRAQERASDYRADFFEGAVPDDLLERYVDFMDVINTAPRDALEIEDWQITPEKVREDEAAISKRGTSRWSLYALHEPSGAITGLTELYFPKYEDYLAYQGWTGVSVEHRNRGLGRWLKAAMMLKLMEDRPQVDRIDTWNAGSNAPMVKINEELGFRLLKVDGMWQAKVEDVSAAIAGRLDNATS